MPDSSGSDLSCLVVSLVQICVDARYRTRPGLLRLFAKEWSAYGFRWGVDSAPYLLLYMDCMNHLLSTYPVAFDYSYVYLVAAHDAILSGLFPQFTHADHQSLGEYLRTHEYDYLRLDPLERFYGWV